MSLIADIAQYLDDLEIGTLSTNIFYSYLPDAVDNAICVLDTGGPQPDKDLPTKEPMFQIFIRSTSYATGKALLDSVRAALHQKSGVTIGSTFFFFILANSEGGHLGRDEKGLDEFSINFHARTR